MTNCLCFDYSSVRYNSHTCIEMKPKGCFSTIASVCALHASWIGFRGRVSAVKVLGQELIPELPMRIMLLEQVFEIAQLLIA